MGERIGYCVRKGLEESDIFRKQWMEDPKIIVKNTWDTLRTGWKLIDGEIVTKKLNPGDGWAALREDLDNTRAFAALVASNYKAPFDSIERDIYCDINDHGLIIIDISDFKNWRIYRQNIGYSNKGDYLDGEPELFAEMSEAGFKTLNKEIEI